MSPAFRRPVWVMLTRILFASLLMDTAYFCAWGAVPFLVRGVPDLWLDDGDLGNLRALASVFYISGSFGLPLLRFRPDPSRVARAAAILTGGFLAAASWAGAPVLLFVALPLGSLALAAFWQNLMALVGQTPGKDLVRRIGTFNCWWSVGKASAYIWVGAMLEYFEDPRIVLRIAAATVAVLAFIVPARRRGPEVASASAADSVPSPEPPGSERFFLAGLLGILAAWQVGAAFETHCPEGFGRAVFGVRFGDDYKFLINLLIFFLFAGQALGFAFLRLWTGWPHRAWTILAAAAVLPATQLVLRVTVSPFVWGAVLLIAGVAGAVSYGQSLYHAQAGRTDKVRRSGIHEGMLSIGSLTGSFGAGHLMQSTGSSLSALTFSVSVGCLVLLVSASILRPRRPRASTPGRDAGEKLSGTTGRE